MTAVNVRHALRLDDVILMVAHVPWQKAGSRQISDAEGRFAMVRAAVGDVEGLSAGRLELDREGPSYTADTLAELSAQHPGAELFTIVGDDAAARFTTWERYEEVAAASTLVVVDRPRYEVDLAKLEAAVPGLSNALEFVPIPGIAFASSDIQRRVREGRPIKYQLPEAVEAYIYAQGLYTAPRTDV